MRALSLRHLHGLLHVSHVIEGIENAHDVDSALDGMSDKGIDHVVRVVVVSHQILAPKEHLKGCLPDPRFQSAKPVPGVFVEVAQTGVERRSAPDLQREVADLIELLGYGEHVIGLHSRRKEGLVGVTKSRLSDPDAPWGSRAAACVPAGTPVHVNHLPSPSTGFPKAPSSTGERERPRGENRLALREAHAAGRLPEYEFGEPCRPSIGCRCRVGDRATLSRRHQPQGRETKIGRLPWCYLKARDSPEVGYSPSEGQGLPP